MELDAAVRRKCIQLREGILQESPFREFEEDYEDEQEHPSSYHLGPCSELRQQLDPAYYGHATIVVFRVVRPRVNKAFLQFGMTKSSSGHYGFPGSTIESGKVCDVGQRFVKSLDPTSRFIGFVPSNSESVETSTNESMFCIYECTNMKFPAVKDINRSLEWFCASELVSDRVLGCPLLSSARGFVTDVSNGLARLYFKGQFLPSPSVGFIGGSQKNVGEVSLNLQSSVRPDERLSLSDVELGLTMALYDSVVGENEIELIKQRNTGSLLRVAYWTREDVLADDVVCIRDDEDSESDLHCERYLVSYCDCEQLSIHTVTSVELGAPVSVVRKNLFILE